MTARQHTPTPTVVDPARAAYVRSEWDAARQMFRHHLTYLGHGATYDLSGFGDGRAVACSCPSYQYSRRTPPACKHTDHLIAMLEHTEYQRQAGRKTWELQRDEREWSDADALTPDARRMVNAIRRVLRERGVRSLASVARGREAAEELAG